MRPRTRHGRIDDIFLYLRVSAFVNSPGLFRGVVKFFNVCNQEQKQIETKLKVEAGPSMRKRDKVLSSIDKGTFLDRLKENTESEEDDSDEAQKVRSHATP